MARWHLCAIKICSMLLWLIQWGPRAEVIPVQPTKQLKYATASSSAPRWVGGHHVLIICMCIKMPPLAPFSIPRKGLTGKNGCQHSFFFRSAFTIIPMHKEFCGCLGRMLRNPVRITHPPRAKQLARTAVDWL